MEGSLRRLGVDSIDLFYLHQPDRATPLAGNPRRTVAELVPKGRSAPWACPTSPPGRSPTSSTSPAKWAHRGRWSRSSSTTSWPAGVEEEYLEFATTHQVHTMVYNPLGGGLLTGKHSFDAKPTEGRYGDSKLAAMYTQRYWDKQLFDAIDELSRIAADAGIPLAELSLRWLAYRPASAPCCWAGPRWNSCRPTSPPWPRARCRPTSWRPATPWAPASAAPCPPTTADSCSPQLPDASQD